MTTFSTTINKPKWYNLRWKVSNALVRMANRVYPKNPEVTAFWMQAMSDQMIYGHSVVRVKPEEMYNIPRTK
jgi:hypothetical protein